MKYNKDLFDLSAFACSYISTNNDELTDEVKAVQARLMPMLLKKFKDYLEFSCHQEGLVTVKFVKNFFSDSKNDGYDEIEYLVHKGAFKEFASEYCIYLGQSESRFSDYHTPYYELTWDYKTYFEKVKESGGKQLAISRPDI